jgi:hypothetical protein
MTSTFTLVALAMCAYFACIAAMCAVILAGAT